MTSPSTVIKRIAARARLRRLSRLRFLLAFDETTLTHGGGSHCTHATKESEATSKLRIKKPKA